MKSFSRIVVAAVTLLAPAVMAVAQTPSGLMNKIDVQKLVSENTPAASASLAGHFAALADRYTQDAARHKDMAKAYAGNGNRGVATNMAPHCARLADIATESATAAREMVTYHEQLAGGEGAVAPKKAGEFHAGKGASEASKGDLHHMAMMANAPADHRALEEYFRTIAAKSTADAESHASMAKAYRAGARKGLNDPAAHCDRLATLSREAAKEATGAASMHRQLANVG